MSFDDYANHIYQKHRLAVALAILKSKPSNIKTKKYLEELKTKVDDKMEVDDITICSDDFLMDDNDDEMNNSVNILKSFDSEGKNNENRLKEFSNAINNDIDGTTSKKPPTLDEDLSQITYYDGSQTEYTPKMADPLSNDISIYKENHNLSQKSDIEQFMPKNIVSNSGHNTVIDKTLNKINLNAMNSNEISNAKIKDLNHKNKDYEAYSANMDATYYDSQKTVLYTVHGFTDNYTHYSPSQSDIIIPNNYIYGNRNATAVQNKENIHIHSDVNSKMISSQHSYEFASETQFVSEGNNIENIANNTMQDKSAKNEEFEYSQTMNMFAQNNDENFDRVKNNEGNINTHITNENNRTINDINTIENNENKHNEKTNILNKTQYSQNIDEYFEDMQNLKRNVNRSNFSKDNNGSEQITEFSDIEITTEPFEYSQNIDFLSQNMDFRNDINEFNCEKIQNVINNPINKDISKENHENQYTNDQSKNPITQNSENITLNQPATITNKTDHSNNKREEFKLTEEELDSEEIISYKVLEEFNKVKTFLNRPNRRMSCDGYSTDSGYRSDSKIWNSGRSSLQLSGNWLNQSGCCLFNYIIQCPLVASTRDITNEIAQVLSQLIDKLHEEEKYPSFLEDLLETVDILLRQVYEGESSGDSELLKKDESIQRMLLLNKSIHIQKHSIEKISNILETFHSKLTETDSTYELSYVDQIENISYIFHLLEILLKKYLKNRDLVSQSSSQLSQDEEKVFKRSSITDIWRKKWNPSQKVFEGTREKKCVLKKCSDVLNKIVVDCVSSYSLVAYSALKCFNSMQS